MKYYLYPVLLLLLTAFHYFLYGAWLPGAWFVTGILLAKTPFSQSTFFFGRLFLLEVLAGIGLCLVGGAGQASLDHLAGNSTIPYFAWVSILILANTITAVLCIYTASLITRLLLTLSKKSQHG